MQRDVYIVRMGIFLTILLLGFLLLIRHLYILQVCSEDYFRNKVKELVYAETYDEGKRGEICDVNGNLLAGNIACYDLMVEPKKFCRWRNDDKYDEERFEFVVETLCRALEVDYFRFKERCLAAELSSTTYPEIVCKRGINPQDAKAIKQIARKQRFSHALRFVESSKRFYPKNSLAANLIGFCNQTHKEWPLNRGATGIEQLMNDRLQPERGIKTFEKDVKGNALADTVKIQSKAEDGDKIYLTVNEPIQQIVEEELTILYELHKPKNAYALMVDPKTGAVMAMAQLPTFNPNDRRTMSDPKNWQNRILSYGYEPGSVMKCVSVAGAIDFNAVTLDDVFYCENGCWIFCNRSLTDAGHHFKDLHVWEIIQKSSNIGVAKIALEMGESKTYQTLRRFGFGSPTDIGLPNEAAGILRKPWLPPGKGGWDGLSISRFPIGQGILVTPLQMIQAYCSLANGGKMMQLHVIDRIVGATTGEETIFEPKIKNWTVRPHAAAEITKAMKTVTLDGGTGTKAAVEGYSVAGKTGTAQKFANGTYKNGKYVASFIGFVPADNPAFVLYIVADEPTEGGHYGGTIAGPTFSRIAEKTLRYLQIPPTIPETDIYAASTETN